MMALTTLKSTWIPFTNLFPYLRPYRYQIGLSVCLAFCQALLNIAFPLLTKHLTDAALQANLQLFSAWFYLALLLILVNVGVTYFRKYAYTYYTKLAIRDLRNRVTAHIQRLPISVIETQHSGEIVSSLNADVTKIESLIKRLPDYLYQPLLFIGAVTTMGLISWKLLLATFILMPASAFAFERITKPLEDHSRQFQDLLAEANSIAQDVINGIYIVKAFNLQHHLLKRYQAVAQNLQNKGLQLDKIDASLIVIFLAFRLLPQLALPLYGGYLMVQEELTVGGFLASSALIWHLQLPIESFLDLLRQTKETAPSIERALSFLTQPTEAINLNGKHSFKISPNAAALAFNQVTFAYDGEKEVLSNLNFQLMPQETVALVGPSGSGKSSLLALICQFYRPQRGVIELSGQNIVQLNPSRVRSQISLVSQDTYLFPTTIAENIGYGRPDADRAAIIAAAKAANAHNFIINLPHGYDTPVGERGNRLSGGQRQRLALARAILKDASLLLLDEPTSALDTKSEALVEEALARFMQDRTVFVVAHRLSTIRNAHRILVLDQGQIVETGCHDILIQQDSLYRKLYLKQVAEPKNEKVSSIQSGLLITGD